MLLFKRRTEWPPAVKSISMDDRLKQNETEERENRQKIWSRWSQLEVFQSNKEDKWLREKRKWMSFLTPGHLQCMCELGCVRVSSVVRSLNADLHCRARRVPAGPTSLGTAVLFTAKATKLLRLKEELLKYYWLLCPPLTTILSLCWWCCLATELCFTLVWVRVQNVGS